jgi:polyisoprenoid-binding protein YceI
MSLIRHIAALILCCILCTPALAKEWVIDYNQSKLGFTGLQGSEAFSGAFKTFQAHIDLDLDKPESGNVTAAIDIASVTAGSAERDSYLPQSDWFNTVKFPQAKFTSTVIHPTPTSLNGPDTKCFTLEGTLMIKDITKPVTLPFCVKREGDHWRADAKMTLNRMDFHIGDHDWASEAIVKYPVNIVITLIAKPGL